MNVVAELRRARANAGLSQAELARRAGTSQATVSAYESGGKQPSIDTLARLLKVTGKRLAVEHGPPAPALPSPAQHRRTARRLLDVLALAEALPSRHQPKLRFPRLPAPERRE